MKTSYLFTILFTFLLSNFTTYAQFGGGDGSQGNPYQISTAVHLASLAANVNNGNAYADTYFLITQDIDLTSWIDANSPQEGWNPIGYYNSDSDNRPFCGNFDGNRHTISGMRIDRPTAISAGLFGHIYTGAVIANIRLTGSLITNGANISGTESVSYTGGIVGYSYCYQQKGWGSVWIQGCSNAVHIVGGSGETAYTGGIIGYGEAYGGYYNAPQPESGYAKITIYECFNNGFVEGSSCVGGIVGAIESTNYAGGTSDIMLFSCINAANIIGNKVKVHTGGICGTGHASYRCGLTIDGCSNSGSILSKAILYNGATGGIIGFVSGGDLDLSTCSNGGNIEGSVYVGGIIGRVDADYTPPMSGYFYIERCYSTSFLKGFDYSGGIVGFAEHTYSSEVTFYIENNYSSMSIDCYNPGLYGVGGILGYKDGARIQLNKNYFDYDFCNYDGVGNQSSASGVMGKPTDQMMQKSTFTGWNFSPSANMWAIWNGKSYPYFQWESAPVTNVTKNGSNLDFELCNPADSIVLFKLHNNLKVRKQASAAFNSGSQSFPITATLSKNDTVFLVVYEPEKTESYPVFLDDFPVGISQKPVPGLNVQLYPNPATTELHIKVSELLPVIYTVYNVTGQKVIQGSIQNSEILDLQNLSKGIYFLKVDGKESNTLKFVKK